jgi:hypothetical protein
MGAVGGMFQVSRFVQTEPVRAARGRGGEFYARAMKCRIEVFVRSGHTIDLSLEDGEDRVFTDTLHKAWASPEAIGFTQLALGENAVILAAEVVGYRRHGSVETDSTQL